MKRLVLILLLLQSVFLWSFTNHGFTEKGFAAPSFQDSIQWADYYYNVLRFEKAIPIYKKNLEQSTTEEKERILKKLALSEAALEHPSESLSYIYDYLLLDFQPSFLLHEGFDEIRETEEFNKVSNRLIPKITFWSISYFFIALIGGFVILSILLNKKIEKLSKILIAAFVLIHSLFILNISITISNYVFVYPHTYLMSTWSSFLYGPLLFLYFKRVSNQAEFKLYDLWHLLPTIILTVYITFTIYIDSGSVKIKDMLIRLRDGLSPEDSILLTIAVILKTLFLILYAYFIHLQILKGKNSELNSKTKIWQRNIYAIHLFYIVTYVVYGATILQQIHNGLLFHAPLILMATMVLYIGYAANAQPHVFNGLQSSNNMLFPKYLKSGLTESLSCELKEDLLDLFHHQKIYRRNDINLDLVAEKLNTTRHNASQIINEQFKMNFHEMVNKYRIDEAKELLQKEQDATIIDIAYEVGYNNKVSFNKAFKKDTQLTPTQYLEHLKES